VYRVEPEKALDLEAFKRKLLTALASLRFHQRRAASTRI